jgi:signal transduction histidine kinase
LGLALLRLDQAIARREAQANSGGEELTVVESAVRTALQEVRAISRGLGLPDLESLTLSETLARVVKVHQRRATMPVTTKFEQLPEQVPLPVKITVYRTVQEALSNAARHAGGVDVQVTVTAESDHLRVEVSDHGEGFDQAVVADNVDHLGIVGMRERVESLGGRFEVKSGVGQGTHISAWLPLAMREETGPYD